MTFHRLFREARLTLVLAAPIVAGQVGQHLMGLVDSLMLAKVGVIPLAASAFALSIFVIGIVALIGLLTPVSVLASRTFGAGLGKESASILLHGVWIAVLLGCAGAVLMTALFPLLGHLGQSQEVVEEAGMFFLLLVWSLPAVLVFQAFKNYCEALARPFPPMVIMLGGVILNFVLNWIMIFGHWGCPPLGIEGAGWATWISRVVIAVTLIVYVLTVEVFREHLPDHWCVLPEWRKIMTMLRLGLPIAGQLGVEVGAFAVGALMMGWINPESLAAHQIVLNCVAITFMIPLGIGMAASIRMGHHVGARKLKHLRSIGVSSYGIMLLFMGTACAVFLLGGEWIAQAFITDTLTVAIAIQMFTAAGIFQIADGTQTVGMGLLRGLQDVKIPLAMAMVSYWVVMLPCGYFLSFHTQLGAAGMWYGFIVGLMIAAVLLTARFFWKTSPKRSHQIT